MEEEVRRFQASRVLGTGTDDDAGPPAAPPPSRRPPTRKKRDPWPEALRGDREPGLDAPGRMGIGVAAGSVFVLVLLLVSPWFTVNGQDRGYSEVREGLLSASVPAYAAVTTMPFWGLGTMALAAAVLVGSDFLVFRRGPHAAAQAAASMVGVAGALVLTVAGTRLWGHYLSEAFEPGPAAFSPHVAAFAVLLAGLAGLYVFLRLFRLGVSPLREAAVEASSRLEADRWAMLCLLAASMMLVLTPLLPIASNPSGFGGAEHVSTLELHAPNSVDVSVATAEPLASALTMAQGLLWGMLAVSAATVLGSVFGHLRVRPEVRQAVLQVFLVNLVLSVALAVAVLLVYVSFIPGLRSGFGDAGFIPLYNWFLPLGTLVAGAAVTAFIVRVSAPFVKTAVAEARARQPAA